MGSPLNAVGHSVGDTPSDVLGVRRFGSGCGSVGAGPRGFPRTKEGGVGCHGTPLQFHPGGGAVVGGTPTFFCSFFLKPTSTRLWGPCTREERRWSDPPFVTGEVGGAWPPTTRSFPPIKPRLPRRKDGKRGRLGAPDPNTEWEGDHGGPIVNLPVGTAPPPPPNASVPAAGPRQWPQKIAPTTPPPG